MVSYQVFMTIFVYFIFNRQGNCVFKDKNQIVSPKEFDIISAFDSSKTVQGVEILNPRGVRLTNEWTTNDLLPKLFHKFWKKYRGHLTFYYSGQASPASKTVPVFSIFHRHKKLPFFEVLLNIQKGILIFRYQGKISFQRTVVSYGESIDKLDSVLLHIKRKEVEINIGCMTKKIIKLRQPLVKIPNSAKMFLHQYQNTEKYTGLIFEAKAYSFYNKKLATCSQDAYQKDESGIVLSKDIDRVPSLEQQVTQLYLEVEKLKNECVVDGIVYNDGEMWQTDFCTTCICQRGKPECTRRTDVTNCVAPCQSSPCHNQGECHDNKLDVTGYQCQCQPPFEGPLCEVRQNPCVWPQEQGFCNETVVKYYYDRFTEQCLAFNYSGCGGNINNYPTLEACQEVAMTGACCFRRFKSELDAIVEGDQEEESKCQVISLGECKRFHRQENGGYTNEVIGFFPSLTCEEAGCVRPRQGCFYDDTVYQSGDTALQGCQECTCQTDGQWSCGSCTVLSKRKEIRDMTVEEITQFQSAVQQLRLTGPGNVWESFRNLYMSHAMHSNGGPYFLPWHRLFLRRIEQKLQEIDCSITIPYFDFTTDVGNFADAIIWQPNYFGGDGVSGCVPDHPFGPAGSWRPCIARNFNESIELPSLAELALALASEDYTEMSMCLETYIGYLHRYIGGDMATTGGPHDPVFYALHAFLDMLYWRWQKRVNNKFRYPGAFGNIMMVPFDVPPSSVLDLENDLCVTYILPSKGHPCNVSSSDSSEPDRGDIPISPENPRRWQGYDEDGFDRRGFNENGYKRDGFNRDGFDKYGYDRQGYDRYGFNRSGYNRYGFDRYGLDIAGQTDTSNRYGEDGFDKFCLNNQGLTSDGYDRFGFTYDGYDVNHCNYLYHGPFASRQSVKIWDILSVQSKPYLMSIQRTCPVLDIVPTSWITQFWMSEIKDVTNLVTAKVPVPPISLPMERFCFDTSSYLSPCSCDTSLTSCSDNPCLREMCPSYPDAVCHVDFCTSCKANWYYNGVLVDCYAERDFCDPNPCENGGTCVESIWPTEPQLVTCQCPPGFDGHLCQVRAVEVCSLPRSTGTCDQQVNRWYYNYQTQNCEEFVYTGCGGNANNFLTSEECQSRCSLGSCCYRYPKFKNRVVGYDSQGYDRYGFNVEGYNKKNIKRKISTGTSFGEDLYMNGYDWQGYDINGYNRQGLDRYGYNREGFDNEGFNITGYSKIGEYDGIIEYGKDGYNVEGFNRAGINCHGYNRRGLNYYGVSAGYKYECRAFTLSQCQRIEENSGYKVIRYSPGKQCFNTKCEESCGCSHGNMTYKFGEQFSRGCQSCICTQSGSVQCSCNIVYRRKEIRDMTEIEMEKFQNAVERLQSETGFPSKWYQISNMYAEYKPQALGSDLYLPWHRYFLKYVEQEIQSIDCAITIPYFDWTVDAGEMQKSIIWAANKFGGNGDGLNGCVQYHPFKNYFPPYWTPCLRRKFNRSISLPDAVNIQILLNEPIYSRFRIGLELMSDLFQTWVGGHIASDLRPYDPLFLSHIAFIDRIWQMWQEKFPESVFRFPPELRYSPMSPFGISPDDVMSSRHQLCVTYIPITLGALCNITLPNYGYDSNGYDRHGYDREGFDRDGFNVYGYDRNREPDLRGIYNIYGFDRNGYNRKGYDPTGYDRYGFYTDMFNIDGFDSEGYDRFGYDRYGFDKNGVSSFGFHRNGTWVIKDRVNIFDPYGYNRFGFDKYGLDRQGYDRFGFDLLGYDRRHCNNFDLGPMVIIIKRWAEQELEKLDNTSIKIIVRVCPALTSLPSWRYTTNWLQRGDQIALIENIYQRQNNFHKYDPNYQVRSSSVTDDLLWMPLTPDKRLCFVTYYYTQCPFGRYPQTCSEDLCRGRSCPGIPDAVCRVKNCGECSIEWYNGISGNVIQCSGCVDNDGLEHGEGTTWSRSECEMCTCRGGLVACSSTVCPQVTCRHPVKMPGQCCASCDSGCQYEDRIIVSGDTFIPLTRPCDVCRCDNGDVTCRQTPCPDLHDCQSTTTLDGECCPMCLDCGDHANATTWREGPCQNCACINGRVSCSKIQCSRPDCAHPYTPNGECCPVCVACFYQGRIIQDGERFQPDRCTNCTCHHGNVDCIQKQCPEARCIKPIQPQGECCPICDSDCDYNQRIYRHNEVFIAAYDPCLNCSCMNSMVRCTPIQCNLQNLPCRNPVRRGEGCCDFVCQGCIEAGIEHSNGDQWTSLRDPCKVCVCNEGQVICQTRHTCSVQCSHGVIPRGECCSSCTDCLYDGRVIQDGQVFPHPGDVCQQCLCHSGNIRCEAVRNCPVLSCTVTEMEPGGCCQRCKGCVYRGEEFQHDDTISADRCSQCRCQEGEVVCTRVQCSPPRCNNPIQLPGECCPECRGCEYGGENFQEGQRFTPRLQPCLTCLCQEGKAICESQESNCPQATCTHPERIPGQCCPSCIGCIYLRRRFKNGQKFVPPGGDPCRVCRCSEGSVTCTQMECSTPNCNSPVRPPGHCCAVCPMGCTILGKEYRDGQTFVDPRDGCKVCTCMMGEIGCMEMGCTEGTPDCTHPVKRQSECCPSCTMCSYKNQIIRNGQTFTDPENTCLQCVCRNGSVTCTHTRCAPVNCINPQRLPGKCCNTCPTDVCVVNGVQYNEGDVFANPEDKCQECACVFGQTRCQTRKCPLLQCRNPSYVAGECCPQCTDCTYENLVFRDGEQFIHPRDECQQCTCITGSVKCVNKNCPVVNCQYPVISACCPVCNDCRYFNRVYRNGQIFSSDREQCSECSCRDGNVTCTRQRCTAIRCTHPVQRTCCAECNDCFYSNRQLRNGQVFNDFNNDCNECRCQDGNVICSPRECPPVACSNPVQGRCCPECRNCQMDNQVIPNGQVVQSRTNQCKQCLCRNGNVQCHQKQCKQVTCQYPVKGTCCRECTNCFFDGQEIRNGGTFSDRREPCNECTCTNGNVDCRRKTCLPVQCNSPVQKECCPSCTDCFYRDVFYSDGSTFSDLLDQCQECSCSRGNVQCYRKQCPSVTCSNPVMGQCCPQCGTDCNYGNRVYRNRESFRENCQECRCVDGSVECTRSPCPAVTCRNPVTDQCCQSCTDCYYERQRLRNGQTISDHRDPCQECTCRDGTVNCRAKPCPAVSCRHPIQERCCPICTDCLYNGEVIRHGQEITDRNDRCRTCRCQLGNVECLPRRCEPVSCVNPVQDRCGCPVCNSCEYKGVIKRNGERFNDPVEPCKDCVCEDGSVRCIMRECISNCNNPAQTMECCPVCTDCFYEGMLLVDGTNTTLTTDPCQTCVCHKGNVDLKTVDCPVVTCDQPLTIPGQCCPSCPVCTFLGETYNDGTTFPHPEDSCQTCNCHFGRVTCLRQICERQCTHPGPGQCCPNCDVCSYNGEIYRTTERFSPDVCNSCICDNGNVHCRTIDCPTLTCIQQEKVPGECCPRCKGCSYQGLQYEDGADWYTDENPCIKCSCYGGIVTCMETQCITTCDNAVNVPGQCCPVCPTCSYKGRIYNEKEIFSPNGEPCDVCTCEEGRLRCHHITCPEVANCPPEQLVSPPPGECCPSCSGFGTNCTRNNIGQITRPRTNEPCIYCECKESYSWICMRQTCPVLICPAAVQKVIPGQCCPQCPGCHDKKGNRYYDEGEHFTDFNDPCVMCQCESDGIHCESVQCPQCGQNERLFPPPVGVCCGICEPQQPQIVCEYQGIIHQPGEVWVVDECTSCECVEEGGVKCTSQRCPDPDCGQEDVPSRPPGTCCPICVSKPATCIVFGDPHYMTFDGVTVHFQGKCKYIMAADCENDDFVVEVQHDNRGAVGDVSWAQNFTVRLGKISIFMLQNNVVMINGRSVDLPYFYEPHFSLELNKDTVLLNTNLGVKLLWNGDSYAELSVPGSYKRKTCGLCGNFNGFPQDDLKTSSGRITNSPSTFGNSWKADTQYSSNCGEARDVDPCAVAGFRTRKFANQKCSVLTGPKFSRCHRVVSPEPFFASCVYDMCVCGDDESCLCEVLSSYSKECAKSGVRLQWRSVGLCAIGCDEEKGFMFDECGPVCARTCENFNTPLGNLTSSCYKPCVASCQCPADKVLHAGECISSDRCPPIQRESVIP